MYFCMKNLNIKTTKLTSFQTQKPAKKGRFNLFNEKFATSHDGAKVTVELQ